MDQWYAKMEERYGKEFCYIAGYFDETKPFEGKYSEVFDLPKNKTVLQFSGAFHPFHEGHLSAVLSGLDALNTLSDGMMNINDVVVVLHADHSEYRNSKGVYPDNKFKDAFELIKNTTWNGRAINFMVVYEDDMPNSCSRNFTRLYAELFSQNKIVYFLSGGDRANYALTFMDDGHCIIAGRDQSPMWKKYLYLCDYKHTIFMHGNLDISSTQIRNQL